MGQRAGGAYLRPARLDRLTGGASGGGSAATLAAPDTEGGPHAQAQRHPARDPVSLKVRKAAATTVLESLLKKGLVAERPAAADAAHWRETRDGGRTALAIADAGPAQKLSRSP